MSSKWVYRFGGGTAEGKATMKELLGGKGANLAEMASLRLPVPPGFTITTELCTWYYDHAKSYPADLDAQVRAALAEVERETGMGFGDPARPLLLSVRSGARSSMPGMMETVLNIGLTSKTIPGLVAKTGNERFVLDAYRRLIMMYSDVVMEKAAGVEPAEGRGIRVQLDQMLSVRKKEKGYASDADLTVEDLRDLVARFKVRVKEVLGREFPDDAMEQLWGGIGAVFSSWNGKRAVSYRRIEGIPDDWGTAVNVQAMVFGNMGESSATGVAFTRNPATGENRFYGEWLVNAQGEDVVAGIRTPNPLNESTKSDHNRHLASLETAMPATYRQLDEIRNGLERHFADMQDIEFTIQDGKLYMLQCRSGKRTGTAALNIAMDMLEEGLIDEKEAVRRVSPAQLDELLHPVVDPAAEKAAKPLAGGLPAGPGGAAGQVVFTAADAVAWAKQGKTVILVREETNPEDVEGMRAAEGILTARGGMTSHAALVARGWGKCCVVGLQRAARRQPREDGGGRRPDAEGRGLGHAQRDPGPGLRREAGDDQRGREPALRRVHEDRGPVPDARRADQRRHPGGRAEGPQLRRRGDRAVPHRAHVLRQALGEAAVRAAQDDRLAHRGRAPGRAGRAVPVRQEGHQGHAGGDGRPAGHDPPARPAAARVRAAAARGTRAAGRGAGDHEGRAGPPGRRAARDQPDDGAPRRPAGA